MITKATKNISGFLIVTIQYYLEIKFTNHYFI